MEFTLVPDFIIPRKRKRTSRAFDPCLGFYIEPPTTTELSGAIFATVPASMTTAGQSAAIPPAQPQTKCDDDSEEAAAVTLASTIAPTMACPNSEQVVRDSADTRFSTTQTQITVEDFLRCAASPTRRYTRYVVRRRTRKDKSPCFSDLSYHPSAGSPASDPYDVTASCSPARKRRRGRRSTEELDDSGQSATKPPRAVKTALPFTRRLILAGASTGVSMVGGTLLPSARTHTSTRIPIPLVLNHRAPSPPCDSQGTRRRFIDPRKTTPFRSSAFQFHPPSEQLPSCPPSRPLSAWNPDGAAADYDHQGRQHNPPIATERLVTIPLKLVPASGRSVGSGTKSGRTAARLERYDRREGAITLEPFTSLSPSRPAVPSAIHLRPCTPSSLAGSYRSLPLAELAFDETSLLLPSSGSPAVVSASPLCVRRPGLPDDAVAMRDAHAVDTTIRDTMDTASLALTSGSSVRTFPLAPGACDTHMRTANRGRALVSGTSVSAKPMKSLMILMDDFREIARSATRMSVALNGPLRRSRPRPRPAAPAASAEGNGEALSTSCDIPELSDAAPGQNTSPTSSCGLSSSSGAVSAKVEDPAIPSDQGSPGGTSGVVAAGEHGVCMQGSMMVVDLPAPSATMATHPEPVDIVSLLKARRYKMFNLPSSPLPGWSALAPSSLGTAVEGSTTSSVVG